MSSPSPTTAAQSVGSLTIDWGAVAVFAFLLAGAIAVVVRAYGAPDGVFRTYQNNLDRTKASIDGNEVIPRLVRLIEQVVARASGGIISLPAVEIEGSLRWAGYLEALATLSALYADLGRLDELPASIVRWARVRAVAAAIGLVALLPVGVHFSVATVSMPIGVWLGGAALALTAFGVAGTAWFLDASDRNSLTGIFRRYRQ
jgi:hypothetical protein